MTDGPMINGDTPFEERAYSIGELAKMFDITPRAIRFYEDQGLLTPRRAGKNRIFSDRERVRLDFILRGKRLGISLAEIREWLELYNMEDGQNRQYQALLDGSRKRITELERQRDDLDAMLDELRAIEALAIDELKERNASANDGKQRARVQALLGRKEQRR